MRPAPLHIPRSPGSKSRFSHSTSLPSSPCSDLLGERDLYSQDSSYSGLSYLSEASSRRSVNIPYWPGVTGRHSPEIQYSRPTNSEWIDVSDASVLAAIRTINPSDKDWLLTTSSVSNHLRKQGYDDTTCDILKPGILDAMFKEADSDQDGYISKKELKIACSVGRFRYRKFTHLWVWLLQTACSVDLSRRHHKVEDCLHPRVQEKKDVSPVRQRIFAQFERPENYPKHCGYGPVDRGEYLTEKLNAGMPARAAAWRSTLSHPGHRRPSVFINKCIGSSVLVPLDIPPDYVPPKEAVKVTSVHSNKYPLPRRGSVSAMSRRESDVMSPGLGSPMSGSFVSRLSPLKRQGSPLSSSPRVNNANSPVSPTDPFPRQPITTFQADGFTS